MKFPTLTAALVLAALLAAAHAGHGGTSSVVHVRVTVTTPLRGEVATKRFSLGCMPVSGSLPLRARVCQDIAAHRQAMLRPRRARSSCGGSPLAPVVQVDSVDGSRHSSFSGMPWCGWPGGTPLTIYWDASRGDAHG